MTNQQKQDVELYKKMEKTKNDQIATQLAERVAVIEKHRDDYWGSATFLLIGEFLTSDEYSSVCDRIKKYYDDRIEADNRLAENFRSL